MKVISVRENPEYKEKAIQYLQNSWSEVLPIIYEDCITNCIDAEQPLPQWYLLEKENEIIGCGGLITNDFISRMDLYPWLCALFIDEKNRGHNYGNLIIERAKTDTRNFGFTYLNLCTDYIGYYEKLGF
ncbi:N-acetyltransferase [Sphingobacterium faecium NBRC 15299]|uniref:GNAT family N-acetyltransferase n=1 Tax=Sphingobacterium faecium TaxID=34087 RepID=UPI000D42F6B6|nr:GNAT family N-acetyltransferase [Sphingobacterium faecium]PTX09659.1 acetyltransferase (GNAT) family protein [Sphingobacterium faecium]GEM63725.1 N-acetyltransferase [Sphingobacterium faecium NBRC 15299]